VPPVKSIVLPDEVGIDIVVFEVVAYLSPVAPINEIK